jgi:pimeloyl-ACP methyl ester carboxylesterase
MVRRAVRSAVGLAVIGLLLASCSSTSATSPPSVITSPVHTIETTDGIVEYRSLGTGAPLVMIMGFAGSQDLWPPELVDDLAAHHRVITFNNAGIGSTAVLPGVLSVPLMADQTAALIAALHLVHPDVFGWSMGGMIAQALAVQHPGLIDRLVLGATSPGNGQAVGTPALEAFVSSTEAHDSAAVLGGLFPPQVVGTVGPRFVSAVSSYPDPPSTSVAVDQAQWVAIQAWNAGEDSAGTG